MQQAKFSLTQPLVEFLSAYKVYGFKDKSSMVRTALLRLKEELELQSLEMNTCLTLLRTQPKDRRYDAI
jgi:hypothetical protein